MVEINKMSLSGGHDTVRVYDELSPETDMVEVNEYIHTLEKEHGMRAFDLEKAEVIHEATRETKNVTLTPQFCGG